MSGGEPGNSSSLRHGAVQLPAIVVDTYNADLRDADGFVGATAQAGVPLRLLVEDWRERLRKLGHDDPLGDIPAEELKKKKLDKVLLEGRHEAAALVHSATEEFARELFGRRHSPLPPIKGMAGNANHPDRRRISAQVATNG